MNESVAYPFICFRGTTVNILSITHAAHIDKDNAFKIFFSNKNFVWYPNSPKSHENDFWQLVRDCMREKRL